ncbi:MAG TPA: inorganic phosphate transporter [Bacteroidales bacterium]|nr:inorganic phosphate transporter [Bacteroidales bacterium]
MFGLETGMAIVLIFCLIAACAFEFINGFHDTANAVATVIYTHSLKPTVAVIWSGIFNFIGVMVGGITVAMGIIHLLPVSILADTSTSHSVAMILAIILSAIIWNIGTWYFGIPCSSSHTLLGSIFGVGLAFGLLPGVDAVALNWSKVKDVGLFLLISPLFGFAVTMALVILLKKKVKSKKLFAEPPKKKKPPFWIRSILVLTCTGVSFSHGSNDGQKGVGLIMIILIAFVPFQFALNHNKLPQNLLFEVDKIESVLSKVDESKVSAGDKIALADIKQRVDSMQVILAGSVNFGSMAKDYHIEIRKDILFLSKEINDILKAQFDSGIKLIPEDKALLKGAVSEIKTYTEYAPWWVILMISLSLGVGTMVGWKRIVVTIGEKIGKEHLTYAQGASAELVAAGTIVLSSNFGLPVSTTHILSSGVAGSMVATNGVKNLRMKTVKNILVAWLVTIPVTIILSGGIYLLLRAII